MGALERAEATIPSRRHDHHRPAKRAGRADPQPDAGDPAGDTWRRWLGEEEAGVDDLNGIYGRIPVEQMCAYPWKARRSVRDNDPDLLTPLAA